MDLSAADIRYVLMALFVLVISVAIHEFGHAIMAYKLGDDTPKRQGRVTLNPLAHADPIGTLLLPVLGNLHAAAGGAGGGFGWGKPVQWQPHRVRRGISMTTANILVSFAGPFMNLLLATIVALVHCILLGQGVLTAESAQVNQVLLFIVTTNFILFFFNLLPVPPLDGGHIAQAFMPYKYRAQFDSFAKFGPFVILAVMLIPQVNVVFRVPANWCTEQLYRAFIGIFA
jgi:Zn-dependent protease